MTWISCNFDIRGAICFMTTNEGERNYSRQSDLQ